jgi:anaerobic magnesium-protoporphyrin IX monomethyl ester cyclase
MNRDHPNVLLLYPKTGLDFGSTVAPPHSLLAVAAPLCKQGYKVKIFDQRVKNISDQDLRDCLSSELLCVGISCMTGSQIRYGVGLAERIRSLTNGAVPIVWGGPHPTVTPQQTILHPNVDIIVVGEGDESFLELIQALESKKSLKQVKGLLFKENQAVIATGERPLLDMETLLPTPWELIDAENYIHVDMYVKGRQRVMDLGQTSRGCPFKCGFCSSATIRKRRWRPMSVKKSLALIIENVERFNLDGFWLRDDEFYIDGKRAHEICLGMIRHGLDVSFYTSGTRVDVFSKATDEQLRVLRKAGAHTLKFGAESGSQRILDLMTKGIKVEQTLEANRRCKKFGFQPAFALMIGYPAETFEDINKTIDLAFTLKKENPQAQIETMATYTALPGTPSFSLAIQHGLRPPQTLEGWADWIFDDYDFQGERIPWFNKRDRIAVGNIAYMSILSNAIVNIVGSIRSPILRAVSVSLARIGSLYFSWRLRTKRYRFVPEAALIRVLRRKLFYDKKQHSI